MVKTGDQLQTIPIEDIDFFMGENKFIWLYHKNGRKYIIDYNLEQLEKLLEPELNRQFITANQCIKDVISYSNSRLKIVFNNPPNKEGVIMNRKKWRRLSGGWVNKSVNLACS